MESNDSPEIPDRGETSDIPGLPSGVAKKNYGVDEEGEIIWTGKVEIGMEKLLAVGEACMIIY